MESSCSLVLLSSVMTLSSLKPTVTEETPELLTLMFASELLKPSTLTDTICSHLASMMFQSDQSLLLAPPQATQAALRMSELTLFHTFQSNSRPSYPSVLLRTVESSTDLSRMMVPFGNLVMSISAMAEEKEETTTMFLQCSTLTLLVAGVLVALLPTDLLALPTPEFAVVTLCLSSTALLSLFSLLSQSSSLSDSPRLKLKFPNTFIHTNKSLNLDESLYSNSSFPSIIQLKGFWLSLIHI